MTATFLIVGPWELRHQEAASLTEPQVTWVPLDDEDLSMRTIAIPASKIGASGPLDTQMMPLAIAQKDGNGCLMLTHLLHVLDNDSAMFFRVDHAVTSRASIADAIAQAFDHWHLRLSNNECYYTYTKAEHRRVALPVNVKASVAAQRFSQDLQAATFAPFAPRFRIPLRRSFDVATAFEFADGSGERAILFGPAIQTNDPSERARPCQLVLTDRGQVVSQQTVALGANEAATLVEKAIGRPCKVSSVSRRLQTEVPVESTASGGVFMVTFEHWIAPNESAKKDVTITYEKIRGDVNQEKTTAELNALAKTVEALVKHLETQALAPSAKNNRADEAEVVT